MWKQQTGRGGGVSWRASPRNLWLLWTSQWLWVSNLELLFLSDLQCTAWRSNLLLRGAVVCWGLCAHNIVIKRCHKKTIAGTSPPRTTRTFEWLRHLCEMVSKSFVATVIGAPHPTNHLRLKRCLWFNQNIHWQPDLIFCDLSNFYFNFCRSIFYNKPRSSFRCKTNQNLSVIKKVIMYCPSHRRMIPLFYINLGSVI